MTLLEQLRKPEEVKRWFDQIGEQAANEIESLKEDNGILRLRISGLRDALTEIASVDTIMPGWGNHCLELAQRALQKDTA